MTPIILFILLLLIGAGIAFRDKRKEHSSSKALTFGLVLFGLGGFGLLNYPLPTLYAGIAIVAALLVAGWVIAESPMGLVHGLVAIVVIIVIGLIFELTPATVVLQEALNAIGDSSSDLGEVVTGWLPE